ncbi:DUF222 domain-containing protein [Kribbella sp. NPDC050241]|uniref:DUF222 domain-containing protein n=1 Tax=Kribbella sp. NPDC050241 TaxID=3364115 RepID=UPI003790736A
MELLGERPIWSMSGSEMLTALDELEADLARRQTYRLQLIAALDTTGHAADLGAHDTTQLLAFRYRLDRPTAHRDVRLARALPKYPAVTTALTAPVDNVASNAESESECDDDIANGLTEPEAVTNSPDAGETARADADAGASEGDGASAGEGGGEGSGAGAGGEDRSTAWLLRPAQAEAIVSALERVPTTVSVEDLQVAEQQLVTLARHLTPSELRKAAKQIRDLLDTDGPEPDEHKAYARESLALITAENGVKFRGYLANENAELLRTLIHTGARPHKTLDGELDPRPREKRQADALTTALTLAATATATAPTTGNPATNPGSTAAGTGTTAITVPGAGVAADHGTTTTASGAGTTTESGRGARPAGWVPGFGAKTTITVTIDLEDLKSAAAEATGGLVYGDNLSAAAIRRLACDANIIPLVLGSNSEPLDVGRSERLVTRAMRRALNTRDKGCVVCGAPPIHCDAHHLRSWLDGGETTIWNLVLLCRRHHIDLHAGHWTITITNGKVHVTRPTWADPPPPNTKQPPTTPQPPALTRPPTHASRNNPPPWPATARRQPATPNSPYPAPATLPASVATPAFAANPASAGTPAFAATPASVASPASSDNRPTAQSANPPRPLLTRPSLKPDAPQATTGQRSAADPAEPAWSVGQDIRPAVLTPVRSADRRFGDADPWDDSTTAGRPDQPLRRADAATMEGAARFAVWGQPSGEPAPGRAAATT